MTTQNIQTARYTFANLTQAGSPWYFPSVGPEFQADGYDHVAIRAKLVSGNVNNFVTLTVQADDGVTGTFEWDESLGMYNWQTNARGTASWIANNSTVRCRLQATNHAARLWRVKIVIVDGAAPANSGIIELRMVKE